MCKCSASQPCSPVEVVCLCACVCRPASSKTDVVEGEGGQGVGGAGAGSEASQAQQQHQQFLGDTSLALPSFGSIDTSSGPLPDGVNLNDVRTFEKLYKEHAEVGADGCSCRGWLTLRLCLLGIVKGAEGEWSREQVFCDTTVTVHFDKGDTSVTVSFVKGDPKERASWPQKVENV